jgi:hypothetical protein
MTHRRVLHGAPLVPVSIILKSFTGLKSSYALINMRRLALSFALVLGSCRLASLDAVEIRVAPGQGTIQEAVDRAAGGDVVVVSSGVYSGAGNRDVNFRGKAITVRGEGAPEGAVIDCDGEGRGFIFESGETHGSVLVSLTIRGGVADRGGAILIEDSSPLIEDCILAGNEALEGGALWCSGSPSILGCVVRENVAKSLGGGILLGRSNSWVRSCTIERNFSPFGSGIAVQLGGTPIIEGCRIASNAPEAFFSDGTTPSIRACRIEGNENGISCTGTVRAEILNCTLVGHLGYVVWGGSGCMLTLTNCILSGNGESDDVPLIQTDRFSKIDLANTIVWGNRGQIPGFRGVVEFRNSILEDAAPWPDAGNLVADPLFLETGEFDFGRMVTVGIPFEHQVPDFIVKEGDYHLKAGSPAVDAGSAEGAPLLDAESNGRPCGAGFDIGPFEAGNCSPPSITFPSSIEIDCWGGALLRVKVLDPDGQGVPEIAVDFHSHDPESAWFPFPRTYTDGLGNAVTAIKNDTFCYTPTPTEIVISSGGLAAGPIPVAKVTTAEKGLYGFLADPLLPFQGGEGSRRKLVGQFGGRAPVGAAVLAWTADPAIARIGSGRVTGSRECAREGGCTTVEFEVTGLKAGKAMFIFETVDGSTYETAVSFSPPFRRGDSTIDGRIDLSDAINTLSYLFMGGGIMPCRDAADADDGGRIDLTDSVFTLAFLFTSGPPPPPPRLECGYDLTEDLIDCTSYDCK